MKNFRVNTLISITAGLCVIGLVLTGCGKAEKDTAKKAAAGRGKTKEVSAEKRQAAPSTAPITEERIYYNFEDDLSGWEVPMWALGKSDYVAGKDIIVSDDFASDGKSSMKIMADFPGGNWTTALVEIQQYLNISPYRVIRANIYLPKDAPMGLKAKMILTVGDNWKFVEMSRSVPLIPGKWAVISANIEPGSYDWKRIVPDEKFAEDVRKIAIRIESNRKPKYSGPIYIDSVRCGK
jgi:hypothetical protein